MQTIELREEETQSLPPSVLGPQQLLSLHRLYSKQLHIQFANPLHPQGVLVRSRGYVGQVRCGKDLVVRIHPKVPLTNLIGLLEWAYQLEDLEFFPHYIEGGSTDALFDFLAQRLAQGVQERLRAGLWRGYCQAQGDLAYGRGRLLGLGKRPLTLACRYGDNTVAVEDNRILAWTLYCLRHMVLGPRSQKLVGSVARLIAQQVAPRPVPASACVGRVYNRLNSDYQGLHRLCRFFLEGCGPSLGRGPYPFHGFLIHMPTLFERFVAAWLGHYLPGDLLVRQQQHLPLSGGKGMAFRIDLAIEARANGKVLAVLDTKYKQRVAEADIQQVVAYAVHLGTPLAYLVYPAPFDRPLEVQVGAIKVRSLHVDLARDLQQGGRTLVRLLLEHLKLTSD